MSNKILEDLRENPTCEKVILAYENNLITADEVRDLSVKAITIAVEEIGLGIDKLKGEILKVQEEIGTVMNGMQERIKEIQEEL